MRTAYFHNVNGLLSHFEPISLDEMDGVKLMDRTDMKFALSFDLLGGILLFLKDHYRVLTIDSNRVFTYQTDYFDTPELNMFFDHHNGKLNRYKIRQRKYIESDLNFLEMKFRNNKGRVLKERIQRQVNDNKAFTRFVRKHTPYNPGDLNLTIFNNFNRFTLVDNMMRERVTVDFNLAFSNSLQNLWLNGLVIIEVKQNREDKSSVVYETLKRNSLRPASISKYCLGVTLLNSQSKTNNFKRTILLINKLSHVELSA
jgi:VTC domain